MTADHSPTLPITVHGHPNADTLLLWHPGAGSDADAVSRLAARIAGGGHRVVVPTWQDGRDLLRSVRYARETAVHPPDALTLVGYDAAAIAALAMALHQRRLGIGLREVVAVGGRDGAVDPVSGRPLPSPPPAPRVDTAITLVAGEDDPSVAWTETTAAAWRTAGWPVTVEQRF